VKQPAHPEDKVSTSAFRAKRYVVTQNSPFSLHSIDSSGHSHHWYSFSTLSRKNGQDEFAKVVWTIPRWYIREQPHGSYYCVEFIFSDFPGQNESFSMNNLFMQNTNVSFQSLAITLETRAMEQS